MIRIPKPGYMLPPFWRKNRRRKVVWNYEEIEAVLAQYDLGRWQLCKTFAGGSSDNVSLRTDKGKKLLKRYFWSLPSTMHEHSILGHLEGTGFPTPRLSINKDGLTYTKLEDRHYGIYDFIDGYCYTNYYIPSKDRRHLVAKVAGTLARYHQLIKGFIPKGQKINGFKFNEDQLWRDVPWHLNVLEQYIQFNEKMQSIDDRNNFILSIVDEIRDDLIELGRYFDGSNPQLSKRIIHGDFSPYNVLFKKSKIAAVLDFGDANLNLRALDLARGVSSFASFNNRYGVDENLALVFLKSYQVVEPLYKKEVEAIPDLLQWRYLQNIIWSLANSNSYQGKLKSCAQLMIIQDRWRRVRWMKDHGDKLRTSLLSMT